VVELSADFIVGLFERDVRARRRLVELLVSEPEIRLAIVNAVLREVALKSDIEGLGGELREELEKLRREFREEFKGVRREFREGLEKVRLELRDYVNLRIGEVGDYLVKYIDGRVADLHRRIDDLGRWLRATLVAVLLTLISTVLSPLVLKILGIL